MADRAGAQNNAKQPKKLSRFEQKTPEEQETERQKIKEAIAIKLKEKEKIIAAVRKNIEQKKAEGQDLILAFDGTGGQLCNNSKFVLAAFKQSGSGDDALGGQIEFDLAARFEYSLRENEKARVFYEKAVEKGHPLAMFNLALWYLEGKNGVKQDTLKALELLKLSADKGVGMAKINLGFMHQNGLAGLDKDTKKAFQLYREGVQDERNTGGDGHVLLAGLYATGEGCDVDMDHARLLLSHAKDKGARVPPALEALVFGPGGHRQWAEELAHRRQRLVQAVYKDMERSEWPETAAGWAELMEDYGYSAPGADWGDALCEDLAAYIALAGPRMKILDEYKMKCLGKQKGQCEECWKSPADMSKCSKCSAWYCNKECQRENWRIHKETCKLGSMFSR